MRGGARAAAPADGAQPLRLGRQRRLRHAARPPRHVWQPALAQPRRARRHGRLDARRRHDRLADTPRPLRRDVGLKHVARLRRLRHLELCGGGVSDAGVARLGGALGALRTLNLSQNLDITDRGVPALTELPVLESLNLSHTRVGTAGVASLARIPSLTSLALHGCEAAPPQAAQLRAALPRLVSLGLEP